MALNTCLAPEGGNVDARVINEKIDHLTGRGGSGVEFYFALDPKNTVLPLVVWSGTGWITSQCSTILPLTILERCR